MDSFNLLGDSIMYSERTWTVQNPTSSKEGFGKMNKSELLKIVVGVFWIFST